MLCASLMSYTFSWCKRIDVINIFMILIFFFIKNTWRDLTILKLTLNTISTI
jgi:hypothetical protein